MSFKIKMRLTLMVILMAISCVVSRNGGVDHQSVIFKFSFEGMQIQSHKIRVRARPKTMQHHN